MNNEEKILQMLEQMNGRLDNMDGQLGHVQTGLADLKSDVSKLNQTVARIEVGHGKKLSALYDAHIDTVRNATTIQALDEKVDNHDHRIFALEHKVSNG